MEERDATSFFKRRGRRAVKSQHELNGELSCVSPDKLSAEVDFLNKIMYV